MLALRARTRPPHSFRKPWKRPFSTINLANEGDGSTDKPSSGSDRVRDSPEDRVVAPALVGLPAIRDFVQTEAKSLRTVKSLVGQFHKMSVLPRRHEGSML